MNLNHRKTWFFLLFGTILVFPSLTFADGPYLNIPPTNAFDKIHSDNGTINSVNFSMPLNIKSGSGISVKSNNSTHTLTISNSALSSIQGTYNTTQANNANVNSGGYKINFINGSGATVHIENSKSGTQVNVTISATGAGGTITNVQGTDANITSSCIGGVCTVNTGDNVIVTNGAKQTLLKSLDLGSGLNNQDIFDDSGIIIRTPNHTFAYTINASQLSANRTINLPITLKQDTFAVLGDGGLNQTFLGKVNFTATSKLAGINIGVFTGTPSNGKPGDIWVNNGNLNFRDTGNNVVTPVLTTSNQGVGGVKTFTGANLHNNNETFATGQNLFMGTANVTTSAVRGFIYFSAVDGTPTGTPASHTGSIPCVYDGKTNKMWCFNGSWKSSQFS